MGEIDAAEAALRFSVSGDALSSGDINGDGLADILATVKGGGGTRMAAPAFIPQPSDYIALYSTPRSPQVPVPQGESLAHIESYDDISLLATGIEGDHSGDGVHDFYFYEYRDDLASMVVQVWSSPLSGDLRQREPDLSVRSDELVEISYYEICARDDFNSDGVSDIATFVETRYLDDNVSAVAIFLSPFARELAASEASVLILGGGGSEGQLAGDLTGGDFNGDGLMDIAIGSYQNPMGAYKGGAVFVFYGPLAGELSVDQADAVFYSSQSDARAGWPVRSGDFNGDGVDDLIVGATGACEELCPGVPEESPAGGVYLAMAPFVASTDLRQAHSFIEGSVPGGTFGYPLLVADLDLDGLSDVIFPATGSASDGGPPPALHLFYGPLPEGNSPDTSSDATVAGVGPAFASGGDANGDGYPDLWITRQDAEGVYLLPGGVRAP